MKILYLNYEWDLKKSAGADTHIHELTRELQSLGHSVIIQNRHRDSSGSGKAGAAATLWRALRGRLSRYFHEGAALGRALWGIPSETLLMGKEKPDVGLTRWSLHQFSSLVAARLSGVPVVFEADAPAALEYRRYRDQYRLLPRLAEWIEARTLSGADGVFVVSQQLKTHFVGRGVPEEKISVVPNGADITRFRPEVADPAVRARFGAEQVLAGFVGSFARFHGIAVLQAALPRVLAERPQLVFLLVGTGELVGELEAYCRSLGFADRVVFTGHVPRDRVPGLVATMDILLAPYSAEEFFYLSPIKLFEYMAAGRAVLAARVGQIPEIITDGENGLLYDPSVPGSFEKELLRLVDAPALREALGTRARQTIEKQFTWRAHAEGVVEVLERARRKRFLNHPRDGKVRS